MELSPIQPEIIDECPRCGCSDYLFQEPNRPDKLCDDCNSELDKMEYDKKHGF